MSPNLAEYSMFVSAQININATSHGLATWVKADSDDNRN